jgi:hypothetical protein
MSKDEGGKPVKKGGVYLDKLHSGREPMKMVPPPQPPAPTPIQETPLKEGREPMKMVPIPPSPPAAAPARTTPAQPPAPASSPKKP